MTKRGRQRRDWGEQKVRKKDSGIGKKENRKIFLFVPSCDYCMSPSFMDVWFQTRSAAVPRRLTTNLATHPFSSRESWENDKVGKNGGFWTKKKKDMTVRRIKKGKNGVKGKQVLGGRWLKELSRSRESEEELSYWKVKKIDLERATDRDSGEWIRYRKIQVIQDKVRKKMLKNE